MQYLYTSVGARYKICDGLFFDNWCDVINATQHIICIQTLGGTVSRANICAAVINKMENTPHYEFEIKSVCHYNNVLVVCLLLAQNNMKEQNQHFDMLLRRVQKLLSKRVNISKSIAYRLTRSTVLDWRTDMNFLKICHREIKIQKFCLAKPKAKKKYKSNVLNRGVKKGYLYPVARRCVSTKTKNKKQSENKESQRKDIYNANIQIAGDISYYWKEPHLPVLMDQINFCQKGSLAEELSANGIGVFKLSRSEIMLDYCVESIKSTYHVQICKHDDSICILRDKCVSICRKIKYQPLEEKTIEFVLECKDNDTVYRTIVTGLKMDILTNRFTTYFNVKTYTI